ncbi:MAG: AIPR family protein [Dehalococcoidia bacterium]|nr:AIPR family protein [Dehalococcoidia bacterium]
MSKESARELYARIEPYIEQYARDFYRGDRDKGFRHWAFREVFLEDDVSDSEVLEKTLIDGPDDFGVDGVHIDDSEEQTTVHLCQSKHLTPGTTVPDTDLQAFLGVPAKLLTPQLIAICRNEETRALHDELIRLVPNGYGVHLIWVTTGTLSPRARKFAEQNASSQQTIRLGEADISFSLSFDVYDLRDLINLFQTHLEGEDVAEPNVQLHVSEGHFHEVPGDYPTLEMTIPVAEIIRVFGEHRYKIFRLNPRGPLANKTNGDIRDTLKNETSRRIFHLLNNGLSAICDSFTREGLTVKVRNFLIVNGCQTTVTLWNARHHLDGDPKVLVNLKLIECPEALHRTIARATNKQAPLRAEDFVSTDPIQIELQRQFDALAPPWFYEVKRGEWARMLRRQEWVRYRDADGSYRRLKSKDVAQAAAAYLGFPGEAKDKIRFFFEDRLASPFGDELSYKDVFCEGVNAVQLLLPAVLLRRISAAVERDKEDPALSERGIAEWLEYARFHLLWLTAEIIRISDGADSGSLPTAPRAGLLVSSADLWFDTTYRVVRQAVMASIRELRDRGAYAGPREFFRSPGYYHLIRDNLLAARDLSEVDPVARLPR